MKLLKKAPFLLAACILQFNAFAQSDSMAIASVSPEQTETVIATEETEVVIAREEAEDDGLSSLDKAIIDNNIAYALSLNKPYPINNNVVVRNRVYKLNWKYDLPITAVATGWSLYAFTRIYDKDPSTVEQIQSLNKDDLNFLDRWAAGNHNDKIDNVSYIPFYIAIPMPLALLAYKNVRKDAASIGFLYLESMAITGLLYTGSVYFVDRYRPRTYSTDLSMDERIKPANKNSFFAGHVALIATASFFSASVIDNYHPHSKYRWFFYGGAAALTGSMVVMRHVSGNHFPTDQLVGIGVGTLSGLLVPHLHRNKNVADQACRISPFMGDGVSGLTFSYRF